MFTLTLLILLFPPPLFDAILHPQLSPPPAVENQGHGLGGFATSALAPAEILFFTGTHSKIENLITYPHTNTGCPFSCWH